MKASFDGVAFQDSMIFPRLVMVVSDQKQERTFFCLKSAGAFADCSLCDMSSRLPQKRKCPDASDPESHCAAASDSDDGDDRRDHIGVSVQTSDEKALNEEVLEIQTRRENAVSRDVITTLKCQILVALHNRDSPTRILDPARHELRLAKRYLASVSAHEYPPALAAFKGMGTAPFHLYRSIAFDRLHALDLGPLRELPDMAFKLFSSSDVYRGYSKANLVQTANQRFWDLPRSCRLGKLSPFRMNGAEKQAGMSGLLRREIAPFLWYCLMGLHVNSTPDEDPLVQTALLLDRVQRDIGGINKPACSAFRSLREIKALQEICFEAGKLVAESLGIRVNTKLHRIMRHVEDHLTNFGCLRKGATDDNETMHKSTKIAYHSSNHHLSEIAPQLLSARARIETSENATKEGHSLSCTEAQLLLTRLPVVCPNVDYIQNSAGQSSYDPSEIAFDEAPQDSGAETTAAVGKMKRAILETYTVEQAEWAVLNSSHPSTHSAVWVRTKFAKFFARFDWWPDENDQRFRVPQVVYAGDVVFNTENRRDAVEYVVGSSTFYGVVQAIFQLNDNTRIRVALLRRLRQIDPECGNEKIVTNHGMKRFAYDIASNDVTLDCVSPNYFKRMVMLVPDPWDAVKRHGINQRLNRLPDTIEERKKSKFFEIVGFKFTSLPENKS